MICRIDSRRQSGPMKLHPPDIRRLSGSHLPLPCLMVERRNARQGWESEHGRREFRYRHHRRGPGRLCDGDPGGATRLQDGHRRARAPRAASASTGGASPPRRCCAQPRSTTYMQHAKDFGLSASNVGYDAKAIVARSRGVSKRLNGGVGFLLGKNKVQVIWGEARIAKPGQIEVKAPPAGTGGEPRRAPWAPAPTRPSTSSSPRVPVPVRFRAWNPTRSRSGPTSRRWCPRPCRNPSW